MDQKKVEAIARAICSYDWRMTDEGFVPDDPCETMCNFCLDQAKYLIKFMECDTIVDHLPEKWT